MMATAVPAPVNVSRDAVQRIHRITRENRSLWYQLTVLQQPERARACGSGMKANSDRRPVDPPPVVELRIIEGPTVEQGKDVTFDYNANFFLYASLEQARTMAHGRVQTAPATNPPILTGVPASGMAYLDRPAEAGYFIFPDLSVRHEGYFRLSFSLFETTKEEKDFDMEPTDPSLPPGVDWRMEIKTQPFNVFSAKKFPGLMESTPLSKTVADQGCRVRIRRDVRMRKRDGKGGGFDRGEDEYRRRAVTPAPDDVRTIRSRSQSNSSEHRNILGAEQQRRRPAAPDGYRAPPPPLPPGYENLPPSSRGGGGGGHLSFGDQSFPQYAAPRHYSNPHKSSVDHQAPAAAYTPTLSSSDAKSDQGRHVYGYHAQSMSSTCPSPTLPAQQELPYDGGYNRLVPASPTAHADNSCRRDSYGSSSFSRLLPRPTQQPCKQPELARSPRSQGGNLDALKIPYLVSPSPISPSRRVTPLASPTSTVVSRVSTTPSLRPLEPQQVAPPVLPSLPTGGKRKHDRVFPQNLDSLHNGQRQFDLHFCQERGMTPEPNEGTYSRADGGVGTVQFNQYQTF